MTDREGVPPTGGAPDRSEAEASPVAASDRGDERDAAGPVNFLANLLE